VPFLEGGEKSYCEVCDAIVACFSPEDHVQFLKELNENKRRSPKHWQKDGLSDPSADVG